MEKIRLIVFILFTSFTSICVAQSIVAIDTTTNQLIRIKQGKLLGVITAKDTIDPYSYQDSTHKTENLYYSPKGFWELDKVDSSMQSIQLKNQSTNQYLKFNSKEITYLQYRKERDSRYRQVVLWVGAVGCTFIGAGSLIDSFIKKDAKGRAGSFIFLTIGVGSMAYLFKTNHWVDMKRYKIVKLE